jgi:hypothetical protein
MEYFQTQNPNLCNFWRALHRMNNVGIFHGHLEYFTTIWYSLRQFGNLI